MKDFYPVLARCPLLEGIQQSDWDGLLTCLGAGIHRVGRQQTVLAEGDPARYVGIVLAGSVRIELMDYLGNRSILSGAQPGELFGESFACAGAAEMPVTVVAESDAVVMLIDCQRITTGCSNACGFHSRLISNLLKIVARKNIQLNQKIEITAKRTTREKLMAYLLSQAKLQGADHFTIPFDRQDLADYLQVERSAMSAQISKLRQEGILESKKNHFRLLRPEV